MRAPLQVQDILDTVGLFMLGAFLFLIVYRDYRNKYRPYYWWRYALPASAWYVHTFVYIVCSVAQLDILARFGFTLSAWSAFLRLHAIVTMFSYIWKFPPTIESAHDTK